MASAAERERQELYSRINRLETLVSTDELTGLLNRRGFQLEIDRALSNSRRYGDHGVLAYVDLDRFKEINDTLGHAMGDAVLQAIAQLLTGCVRTTDMVARLGGDEYALLLKRTTLEDGMPRLTQIAERLDPATLKIGSQLIDVRASIGFYEYDGSGEADGASLLASADAKMYDQKRRRSVHYNRHRSLSRLQKIA